jgi:uncharacterized protein YjiS (DUF1127 family)
MDTAVVRSPQSLAILKDRMPSRSRLCAILSIRWRRKNQEAKHDSLHRLSDRLFADVGLYREHRIHDPENRANQQPVSPVPVALLAMWMPRV